jgi:non-specific serine/threonine protein kinase
MRAGVEITLEPKAFATLLELLARPGELVTRNQLLDAVWGHRYVTPATLSRVVKLLRRAFGDDAADPDFFETVHGLGYRYIGPVERQARTAELRARFEPPPGARLPAKLDALIGREEELRQLQAVMEQHRAVTIVGTGGIGKTQCALELARRCAGSFPDGVWFSDLVPFDNVAQWLQSLGSALAVRSEPDSALPLRIAAALQGRRMVLLLDNCDRIALAVGEVVIRLLRECEDLKVLATSQVHLNFVGEQLISLPPLALPAQRTDGESDSLEEIAASPAVNLFITRAQAVRSGFSLTSGNCDTIVRICRRLDGLALALELAAARLGSLSADEVLERLERRFQLLVGAVSGRADRHQTLSALLDWSFTLLSELERRLLCTLSVFVPSWTAQSAEEVAHLLGFERGSVMDLLGKLVSKSLVSVDPTQSPARYRLLESVRAFALQQLVQMGLEQQARDAHLAHCRHIARLGRREVLSPASPGPNGRVADEYENVDAALEWALSPAGSNQVAAIEIAGGIALHVKSHGEYLRGAQWLQRALGGSAIPVSPAGAELALGVGVLHFYLQTPQARPALMDAARIARETGDRWTLAYAIGYHACFCALADLTEESDQLAHQTRHLAEELDDNTLRGLAALARGFTCLARGDLAQAVDILSEGAGFGHDIHQQHFLYMYAGLASFGLGDLARAASIWADALVRSIQVRNIRGAAGSVEGNAYIDVRRGEFETAAWRLGAAESVRERSCLPLFKFWRPHHAQACAAARTALGDKEYDRAFSQGRRSRIETALNQTLSSLQQYAVSSQVANSAVGS